MTPIDYFLEIFQIHRLGIVWGRRKKIRHLYDPNQQYQDILRSLLHSGVGTYASASEIAKHEKKTELVNMFGNSESVHKPNRSANPLHANTTIKDLTFPTKLLQYCMSQNKLLNRRSHQTQTLFARILEAVNYFIWHCLGPMAWNYC